VAAYRHPGIGGRVTGGRHPLGRGDYDFTGQELKLKLNTQLTREIGRRTTELHNRYAR
jgi:hypothetical protein